MTNKQIIIDGVDVSGCEAIDNRSGWCSFWEENCAKNPDCIHKKYLRKEQECEELDKELHKNFEEKDTLHLIIDRLLGTSGYDTNIASAEDFEDVYENIRYEKQQLDQLKAENEKLKEQLTMLDDEAVVVEITVEQFEEYKKLKAENETLFKAIAEVNRINKRLETENEKLKEEKQGLIKDWEEKKNLGYEIACKNEKLKQTLTEIKEIAKKETQPYSETWRVDGYSKILQKISEVINEN